MESEMNKNNPPNFTPIADLHPHQALALVNRWAKLKGYWYYEDLDALYEMKDEFIVQWLQENSMVATKIIERESPAIAGMKAAIASGGSNLEYLDHRGYDWWKFLETAQSFPHFQILTDIVNGQYKIPLAIEVQKELGDRYQQQNAEYHQLMIEYESKKATHESEWKQLKKDFYSHIPEIKSTLKLLHEKTTKSGKVQQLKKLNKVLQWFNNATLTENQISQIIEIIKQRDVQILGDNGIVIAAHPLKPVRPQQPLLYTEIGVEGYVPGSLPYVESALEWARVALKRPDLQISDIDEDLVGIELEEVISDEALLNLRRLALLAFEKVISGKLTGAKEIYDELVALDLDYSEAIGMNTYSNYGHTSHGKFCKWHEINLDHRGLWLVEFESTVDREVCFHVPYNRALELGIVDNDLPIEACSQDKFGREISITEQKEYPITDLLKVLGKKQEDFPHNLQNYTKSRHGYSSYRCYDDEDDYITEFDEDEWEQAGY